MILRPHHLLCMKFFIGEGYSNDFTKNMSNVISKIKEDPDCKIVLKSSKDVICEHCHYHGEFFCDSNEKVSRYDENVLEICGFESNVEYKFSFLNYTVNKNIIEKKILSSICSDCSWYSICSELKTHHFR